MQRRRHNGAGVLFSVMFAEQESGRRTRLCAKSKNQGTRTRRQIMPRKPGLNSEFVMFDVVYEDGTMRSNRKVPRALTGGIDGDKPAHGFLIEQDRDIAEKSGRPLAKIKSINRSGSRKKERDYSERQFQ